MSGLPNRRWRRRIALSRGIRVLTGCVAFLLWPGCGGGRSTQAPAAPGYEGPPPGTGSILGTGFSPRNFPQSFLEFREEEIDEYFRLTKQIGTHVYVIPAWGQSKRGEDRWKWLMGRTQAAGLKFFLGMDPLTGMTRRAAAPPATLRGTSFGDPDVREAFRSDMLRFASWRPDILWLGVEVNLMLAHLGHEDNPDFWNYLSLSRETYRAIKERYPSQLVSISFSWGILRKQGRYDILEEFRDSLDIYTFSDYPSILGFSPQDPGSLPADYFSAIRRVLPSQRVAISELAWYSGGASSEEAQAEFFGRLPELTAGLDPEFVTLTYLFDLPEGAFEVGEQWTSAGLIRADGTPKQAWEVVRSLEPER